VRCGSAHIDAKPRGRRESQTEVANFEFDPTRHRLYSCIMKPTAHIDISPDVCSGRPRVAGTRIRVQNIVAWSEQGETPDEIVAAYPQLSLASLHAALAFYYDNRESIDRMIAEDRDFISTAQDQAGVSVD